MTWVSDVGAVTTLLTHLWAALVGVVLLWRLLGPQHRLAALTFGPFLGLGLSSLTVLGLWGIGLRSVWAAVVSPALLVPAMLVTPSLSDRWYLPAWKPQDLRALALTLLLVPMVVSGPFSQLGQDVAEGKAYRAYFTADYVWRRAVVAELAKGELAPANPFLVGETMHYYWLPHLNSAAVYRSLRGHTDLDQLLIAESWLVNVGFLALVYGLARWAGASPWAAAGGTAIAVLATSAEGVYGLWVLWNKDAPLDMVRVMNIDALSRWELGGMPIDGLQRILFYQPHHALGYGLGFLGVLAVVARTRTFDPWVLGLGGLLLGLSALTSSFAGLMLTCVAAVWEGASVIKALDWKRAGIHAVVAALPLATAAVVVMGLGYVDRSGSVLQFGLNPVAIHRFWQSSLLSAGPIAAFASVGLWLCRRQRLWSGTLHASLAVVCLVFFFFIDVRDHQHVYVGWRVGHLWFIAAAGLAGLTLSWVASLRGWSRAIATVVAAGLVLVALPTTLIDIYNTGDIANRAWSPSFRWTMVIPRSEWQAYEWLKRETSSDALIQWDSEVRGAEGWANIPAFAERRLAAGLPISMVPMAKYEQAAQFGSLLFSQGTAALRHDVAAQLRIDYVYIGPQERHAHPESVEVFRQGTDFFEPVFDNGDVTIYRVRY
jgi:hypothetical protein